MSMVRTHAATDSATEFRLIYCTRSPDTTIYGAELDRLSREDERFGVAYAYSRAVPPGWPRPPSRVDRDLLAGA
jgi:ferredoxin-NADP reductase